ncbi:MAG: hypothetical protein SynsKO_40810 [Synoicihabitans sp.]
MDNPIIDLETELQQLTPARPRAALIDRLAAELNADSVAVAASSPRRSAYRSATNWNSWKWANWTVAAGLAVVMTLASLHDFGTDPRGGGVAVLSEASPEEVLRPVRAARTLVESRPEGVIELPDGSPVERVRDYFIDTIEWQDGSGAAQLRWEVPRESIRFVALTSY